MIGRKEIEGVRAIVQNKTIKFSLLATVASLALFFAACDSAVSPNLGPGVTNPNEVAATVDGTEIKMEEVERILKQQARGEESKLSPLELAAARLQVLDGLIQKQVLYQKAEAEKTVPSDQEVNAELNRLKTESGKSREQFEKELKQSGNTEESLKKTLKKDMAINKLVEKITGKIEPPKESEIEAFYNGNREAFKAKRGAQLAAIVIDPRKLNDADTTTNQVEAQQRAKEIGDRLLVRRADFATLAREFSEDPQTRARGGDWQYFTEDQMKQAFGPVFADFVMNKMQTGEIFPQAIVFEGKILIIKLQDKKLKDEDQTLETPGVREKITKALIDSRKQLLSQSYAAVAMSDAKIRNLLAEKVIENPNELSGARPAATSKPGSESNENSNSNASNSAANAANANLNAASDNAPGNSNAEPKKEDE